MQVLASLIYTASTLHAAVNFPQRPILTFAPNTPGAIYSAPPTDKVRSRVVLDSGPNVFDVQKYRISIHNFGRNLCPILWQPSFVSLICIIYIYICLVCSTEQTLGCIDHRTRTSSQFRLLIQHYSIAINRLARKPRSRFTRTPHQQGLMAY